MPDQLTPAKHGSTHALGSANASPACDESPANATPATAVVSTASPVLLDDGLLRIGELAKRTGKTVRALHLYEELGLLRPDHRSTGGFRLYHPSSVARVEWIAKLQDAGFSLNALKDLLRDVGGEHVAPEAMARVRAVFEVKLEETRAAVLRLVKLEKDLVESLSYLAACKTCAPVLASHECSGCHHNGHEPRKQPLLVAGIHHS